MILVTGAIASGKRTFVASIGFSPADMADATLGAPVVFNVQDMLVRQEGVAVPEELIDELCRCKVVIVDEVGCGVHPLERAERDWREAVGRLTCKLSEHSEAQVRMVCGIPTVLKGDPWNC